MLKLQKELEELDACRNYSFGLSIGEEFGKKIKKKFQKKGIQVSFGKMGTSAQFVQKSLSFI